MLQDGSEALPAPGAASAGLTQSLGIREEWPLQSSSACQPQHSHLHTAADVLWPGPSCPSAAWAALVGLRRCSRARDKGARISS